MIYKKLRTRLLKYGIILTITGALLAATTSVVTYAESNTQVTTTAVATNGAEYEKTEVIYGTLKNDGTLDSMYVVNQFEVSKAGAVIDYGTYDVVTNLTNRDEISIVNSVQSFETEEGYFYYQGNISNGTLPWNVEVTYSLNGVPITAEELAGQEGSLEIHLQTSKNSNVNSVFFENYLLQVSFTLDNKLCSNLNATGASVAAAGENKQISYTVMPGKEADITLTVDVFDFEMDAISIAAIPFTMDFDIPDTTEMSDGLTALADGIGELNDGITDLKDGATSLGDGMGELNSGYMEFASGIKVFSNGIKNLDQGLQEIYKNLKTMKTGAAELATGANSVADALNQLSKSGSQMIQGSQEIGASLSDANATLAAVGINPLDVENDPTLQAMLQLVASGTITADQYGAIVKALGTVVGLDVNYSAFESGLEQYINGVSQTNKGFAAINSGMKDFASGVTAFQQGFGELVDGSGKLVSGSTELVEGSTTFGEGMTAYQDGITEFVDGVGLLSDGTNKLANETKDMPDEMQIEIDDMVNDYEFEFDMVSFISEENQNTSAVQFVITTGAIEQEEIEQEPEVEKSLSFFERIKKLFTGLFD